MRVITTDCLVIGAGLAGSAYALQMAASGFTVEVLALGDPQDCNSDWAQGGYVALPQGTAISPNVQALPCPQAAPSCR